VGERTTAGPVRRLDDLDPCDQAAENGTPEVIGYRLE
jgi:hypothetical protein